MADLKIFRKAISIYSDKYNDFCAIDNGVDSAFGTIFKVLNSIKNRDLNETQKNVELDNFKGYVVRVNNNKIFNVDKKVFNTVYSSVFNERTKELSIDELSVLCGYMIRLVKSKILGQDIQNGLTEEINVDKERIKHERQIIEEQRKIKEQMAKEEQEKALEAMSTEDRFKYELEHAPDKEKFATDELNKIISGDDVDKMIKAKILLDFYSLKKEKSKKVKEKIKKLNEMLS